MRNILEKVRRRDDAVKADAHASYRADRRREAQAAFCASRRRWHSRCGAMVRQLEHDLPELLSFFNFPPRLWQLRNTNIIERGSATAHPAHGVLCECRSVDRIIYSILYRFNLEWKTLAPCAFLHKRLDVTQDPLEAVAGACIMYTHFRQGCVAEGTLLLESQGATTPNDSMRLPGSPLVVGETLPQ